MFFLRLAPMSSHCRMCTHYWIDDEGRISAERTSFSTDSNVKWMALYLPAHDQWKWWALELLAARDRQIENIYDRIRGIFSNRGNARIRNVQRIRSMIPPTHAHIWDSAGIVGLWLHDDFSKYGEKGEEQSGEHHIRVTQKCLVCQHGRIKSATRPHRYSTLLRMSDHIAKSWKCQEIENVYLFRIRTRIPLNARRQ